MCNSIFIGCFCVVFHCNTYELISAVFYTNTYWINVYNIMYVCILVFVITYVVLCVFLCIS